MNESVRARLVDDSVKVPLDAVSRDGVVIFGESSAWPREVFLRLRPISPGTRKHLEVARRRHGWDSSEIKLKYQIRNGEMFFRGAFPDSLPAGTWEVDLDIYDVISGGPQRIQIPEGSEAPLDLPVKNDVKAIAVKPLADWDPKVRAVLAASTLDGAQGDAWARDGTVRANRRACALNVLAVCRELGVVEDIRQVFLAEVDRIHAGVSPDFRTRLQVGGLFHDPKPPGHEVHERVLDGRGLSDEQREQYELLSYRQQGNPSLQVVTATPPGGNGPHFADIDVDLGDVYSPLGLIVHTIEIVHPQRTDHLGHVRRLLEGTSVEPFLCWDPIQS